MNAKKLKKGDTIGICAPSKKLSEEHKIYLKTFCDKINSMGYKVKFSKNLFKYDYFSLSSSPQERADDFNDLVNDSEVNLIWCFQGGDNANQIIDLLNFEALKNSPKIIIGKSDIDVVLLAVNIMSNLKTFTGCDSKIGQNSEFDFEYTQEWFEKRLVDKDKDIVSSKERLTIKLGVAEGKFIGCNITSILKLAGTKYFPDFNNSILGLESYKATLHKLVAQITQLKMLGVFDKINGLLIGNINSFDAQESNMSFEEVVAELLKDYNFPILKINEFGHFQPHAFIPIGAKIRMDADKKELEIIEEFLV